MRLEEQIWTEGLNEIVSPGHRAPWRLAKAVVVDSGKESSYTLERARGLEINLKLSRYGTGYLAHMWSGDHRGVKQTMDRDAFEKMCSDPSEFLAEFKKTW
jgi:hypothetical protein